MKCPHCGKPHPSDWVWCPETRLKLEPRGTAPEPESCGTAEAAQYVQRGEDCLEEEDWDSAIKLFTEAIRLDPNNAAAYRGRGKAFYATDEYAPAIADFTKAIKLDPKDEEPFFNRGVVYQKQEEYDSAIENFSQCIRLTSDDAKLWDARLERGYCYFVQAQYSAAIKDFEKSLELNPDVTNAYYWCGMAYFANGDYAKAIKIYSRAIELDDTNNLFYGGRADCHRLLEHWTSAISDYNRAIKLLEAEDNYDDESLALLYNQRGVSYSYKQNKEKALADFETAIRLNPNEPQYKKNRDKVKSACFITTAVCLSQNKPDDCPELTAFRGFRDNWLAAQSDGKEIIADYYRTAPKIVKAIDASADSSAVYESIWSGYLEKCFAMISNGEFDACKQLYMEMVHELERTWI